MCAPTDAAQQKGLDLMRATLDAAGVNYTEEVGAENVTITFAPDTYYVGSRLD